MKVRNCFLALTTLMMMACSSSNDDDAAGVPASGDAAETTRAADGGLDGVWAMPMWDTYSAEFQAEAIASGLRDSFNGVMVMTVEGEAFRIVLEGDDEDPGDTGTLQRDDNRVTMDRDGFVTVFEFDPAANTLTQVAVDGEEVADKKVVFTKRL